MSLLRRPAHASILVLALTALVVTTPSLAAGPSGQWSQLPSPAASLPHPQGRVFPSAVYDPDGARMVIFGGYPYALNDVWQLNLTGSPVWTQLFPGGDVPSGRWGQAGVYDPVRKRMIIMGGYDNTNQFNTVYALSLTGTETWTQIVPLGTLPGPRRDHAMLYDPVGDRLIVFGGYVTGPGFSNDVWSLNLSGTPTWTQITPAGAPPSGRSMTYAIYDPMGQRMLFFGGWTGFNHLNELWSLDLSGPPTWTQLAPGGTLPGPRRNGTAVYDAANSRMVIFGGRDDNGVNGETWQLSLSGPLTWSFVPTAGPSCPARYAFRGVLDTAANRLVVTCGYIDDADVADAWGLSLGAGSETWSLILGSLPAAPPNADYAMAYDASRNRAVYFDGKRKGYFNETWLLALGATPSFNQLNTTHHPSPRYSHSGVFDATNDRMLVFGGYDGSYLNDLWALNFTGTPDWTGVPAIGPLPSPRLYHSAITDPVRQRMVIFGGEGLGNVDVNDVWVMPYTGPPQWTQLSPSGTAPFPRWGHSALYDPTQDRMLVFGGFADLYGNLNELWALNFTPTPSWVQLTPMGTPPPPRRNATLAWDSMRNRMLLFGGFNDIGGWMNDVWELSSGPTPAWTQLAPSAGPPEGRNQMQALYEPSMDRMAVYGGWNGYSFLGDTWFLTFEQPVAALIALARAERTSDGVKLEWQLGQGSDPPLAIQRSLDGTEWNELTRVSLDPSRRIQWLDNNAPVGQRVGYRLLFSGSDGSSAAGEVWVEAGTRLEFALQSPMPNPATDRAMMALTLPEARETKVEIVDLAGRRVRSLDLGMLQPGEHRVALDRLGSLPAGLYLVRLTSGARSATSRLMIVR